MKCLIAGNSASIKEPFYNYLDLGVTTRGNDFTSQDKQDLSRAGQNEAGFALTPNASDLSKSNLDDTTLNELALSRTQALASYDIFRVNYFFKEDAYYFGKEVEAAFFCHFNVTSAIHATIGQGYSVKTFISNTTNDSIPVELTKLSLMIASESIGGYAYLARIIYTAVAREPELFAPFIAYERAMVYRRLWPTTGVYMILAAIALGYHEVYVTGMDFYGARLEDVELENLANAKFHSTSRRKKTTANEVQPNAKNDSTSRKAKPANLVQPNGKTHSSKAPAQTYAFAMSAKFESATGYTQSMHSVSVDAAALKIIASIAKAKGVKIISLSDNEILNAIFKTRRKRYNDLVLPLEATPPCPIDELADERLEVGVPEFYKAMRAEFKERSRVLGKRQVISRLKRGSLFVRARTLITHPVQSMLHLLGYKIVSLEEEGLPIYSQDLVADSRIDDKKAHDG